MKLVRDILNLFFPPYCITCDEVVDEPASFCNHCRSKVEIINPPFCIKCGIPFKAKDVESHLCGVCLNGKNDWFNLGRSAGIYDFPLKDTLFALKYSKKMKAIKVIKKIIKESNLKLENDMFDFIVPMPLHYSTLLKRGFNQAELIADILLEILSKPVVTTVLKKIAKTKDQTKLGKDERFENVKGAFTVLNREKIKGKKMLLVDDVITTGATLKEAAKVLKKAGASEVSWFTFLRGAN